MAQMRLGDFGMKGNPTNSIAGEYSHCEICGRKLTNPISIARGIGPICWGKVFLHPLLRITEFLDQGPRTNNDNYPTLDSYLRAITRWNCPGCGTDLHDAEIHHHKHEDGWSLHGFHEKQWIYLLCPNCKINFALWKLGVSQTPS